jgi:CRISPR/Cas system-associated exonuclease Cas4 (RecB family)
MLANEARARRRRPTPALVVVFGVVTSFSWSLSRHTTFATCLRRYYYAYYGAQQDPEIRRLKALSALPLWAGSVVHEAIERFLKTTEMPLSEASQEAFIRDAVHGRMASEWRESEAGSHRFRLFEHEYAVAVEQEDKRIAVDTVRRSLREFFSGETLAEAQAVGRARWLSIEDLVSFRVDEIEVFLRMDLAFSPGSGRAVIVDWKTGRSEGRFNALQIAGYALYAAERGWVESPEAIETRLEYLSIPRTVRQAVTADALAQARAFVRRSTEEMKALLRDPLTNEAREEDFARIDRPQVCRRCNFRRLCFPRPESSLDEAVPGSESGPSVGPDDGGTPDRAGLGTPRGVL